MSEREFTEYWAQSTREIFRLSLPTETYSDDERKRFHAYQATGRIPTDEELSEWFGSLSELAKRGVTLVRLQVVARPISPFTLFELNQLLLFQKKGERVLFVEEEEFRRFAGPDAPDFWLFDRARALVPLYDENGKWSGYSTVPQARARQLGALRDQLMEVARTIDNLPELRGKTAERLEHPQKER